MVAAFSHIFIEHMAVSADLRGRGLGSLMMRELFRGSPARWFSRWNLLRSSGDPLRRILFYKKLGFVLNDMNISAGIFKGQNPVRMQIMSLSRADRFGEV
jgi:ribosomal protein S18 acetylase RimI-like enzyme